MEKVLIVTDSSSDLPENIPKDLPIKVLPMSVSVKDEPDMDISNISTKEFYDLMRAGKILPTTSQVNVVTFMEFFTSCIDKGVVPIFLGLSSRLTGSFQSALLAKKNIEASDEEIIIIDSKCASLGLGMVVLRAAKMAKTGKDPKEIAKAAEHYALHTEHIFTVDSLEHLKRGGRISATKAFVGGLLKIKPILYFKDGAILPLEKVRGRKNIIRRMVEIMRERGNNLENQVIGISHGDNEELASELEAIIREEFKVKDIVKSWIGPVVGSHSGPGTTALFFQN